MKLSFLLSSAVIGLIFFARPALSAEDAADCADHPLFSRMPDYYISDCESKDADSYDFQVDEDSTVKVEGKYFNINYAINDGAKPFGGATVMHNYTNVMKISGWTVVYNNEEAYEQTARMIKGGKETWAAVGTDPRGEAYWIVVIERPASR